MTAGQPDLTFGPVPSRRLGRSLGINHIPPKTCSYACVYCQLGRTTHLQITRTAFYPSDAVVSAVAQKCAAAAASGDSIDYLTFALNTETLNLAYQLYAEGLPRVELLIGYEGNAFAATGDAAADLLSITAVHLLREEAVATLLARSGTPWDVVEGLTARGALVTTE